MIFVCGSGAGGKLGGRKLIVVVSVSLTHHLDLHSSCTIPRKLGNQNQQNEYEHIAAGMF